MVEQLTGKEMRKATDESYESNVVMQLQENRMQSLQDK